MNGPGCGKASFGRRQRRGHDVIARSSSALQPTAANSPPDESSLTLSGFQTPARQRLRLLVRARPPRRDLLGFTPRASPLPGYARSLRQQSLPQPAESCPARTRDVPCAAPGVVNPECPWDLENCTPGEGCGSRSRGWVSKALDRASSPLGLGKASV